MRLVVLWHRAAGASQLVLSGGRGLVLASVVILSLFVGVFALGWQSGSAAELRAASLAQSVESPQQIAALRARVQERIDALAARMGLVNAQLLRLEALGRRLTEMAKLDPREFNFDAPPALGGPESEGLPARDLQVDALLSSIESQVIERDAQLGVLEDLILQRSLRAQMRPEGRPVERGYLSSGFGYRQDPFTGLNAFHQGIDFSGEVGDPVISVGGGIVTYAGLRPGYGRVVEIAHGDGYVTRYAHNERLLVERGAVVMRGQQIAHLGSTGRSTGPHVHFEVWRNGRPVNPLAYVAAR